jgi:hypothetical protein
MSIHLILPTLPIGRMEPVPFGPTVPPATSLGKELSEALPRGVVEALDKLGDQIRIEVLEPIVCAETLDAMARAFERLYPRFQAYQTSTILIIWASVAQDPQRFSALTIRSFHESESLIRDKGPKWLGSDGISQVLAALATIRRVAKAAPELTNLSAAGKIQPEPRVLAEWANAIVAFGLTFSVVVSSLQALSSGTAISCRLQNIVQLAHWSKAYAAKAYHLAKVMGLLKPVSSEHAITQNDAEDLALAEAGLDDYSKLLLAEDHQ